LINSRVAWFLSRKEIKSTTFFIAIIASLTTFAYGWMSAIPLWILTRILWGVCFSTLRLGSILYALDYPKRGLALGLSRAVIELGPVIALVVGPLLLENFGRSFTFLAFGFTGMIGAVLFVFLSDIKTASFTKQDLKLSFPSSFNWLTFFNAFVTEGVLVVLVGKLTNNRVFFSLEGLALTGFLLSYRRVSFVIFSPLAGWLADKIGFQNLFFQTSIFTASSLIVIFFGANLAGIIAAFTFSAMNASIATGGAITTNGLHLKEVSDNATWRDIGTAAGAFVGAALLTALDLELFLLVLFILYAVTLIFYQYKTK
jgi:predicted MFS family arabinose efflux permease